MNKWEEEKRLIEQLIKMLCMTNDVKAIVQGDRNNMEPDGIIIFNDGSRIGIEVKRMLDEKKLIWQHTLLTEIEKYLNDELPYTDPKIKVQIDLNKLPLSGEKRKIFMFDCVEKLKDLIPSLRKLHGEYSTTVDDVPIKVLNSNNSRIIVTGYTSEPFEDHSSYSDAITGAITKKSKKYYSTKKTWLLLKEMTYRLHYELYYETEDLFEKIKKIRGYSEFENIYVIASSVFTVEIIQIIPSEERYMLWKSNNGPISVNEIKLNKIMEKK